MFAWRGAALVVGVVWVLTLQATARDCVVTDDGDLAPGEPTVGTTLRSESLYTVNVLRASPLPPKSPKGQDRCCTTLESTVSSHRLRARKSAVDLSLRPVHGNGMHPGITH